MDRKTESVFKSRIPYYIAVVTEGSSAVYPYARDWHIPAFCPHAFAVKMYITNNAQSHRLHDVWTEIGKSLRNRVPYSVLNVSGRSDCFEISNETNPKMNCVQATHSIFDTRNILKIERECQQNTVYLQSH